MSFFSARAEKFNACRDSSIWSAYLINVKSNEVVESYLPEEFFTDSGGCLPGYNENRNPDLVPNFIYSMESCDLDSF
ncbi:MAG: hypothetical protein J6X12_08155 [Paludibacteraceae bacterium]|nr:hypothetical protein [Paludibacteraceae bacterium]